MTTTSKDGILHFLDDAINNAVEARAPHHLYGAPTAGLAIKGKDENGKVGMYCLPVLALTTRAMSGNPLSVWFDKDYKKSRIVMRFEFRADPSVNSPTQRIEALRLWSVSAQIKVSGDSPWSRTVEMHYNMDSPQMFEGRVYFEVSEFEFIQDNLEKNQVSFHWDGKVRYYDIGNDVIRQKLIEKKSVGDPAECYVSGEIDDIIIKKDDVSAYGAVQGLLDWKIEKFGDNVVIYKDTMVENTFDFLPQKYWIMADPDTNRPCVTAVTVPGDNPDDIDSYRLLVEFAVGPYYHPGAERDLYSVISRRSSGKTKHCYFSYGGFQSAQFVWSAEFLEGFYKDCGVKRSIEGEVATSPSTTFRIALECKMDAVDQLIKALMSDKGLQVGHVVFDDRANDSLKVDVDLRLRKLTDLKLVTKVLPSDNESIPFPFKFQVLNYGEIGVNIEGCKISMLGRDKNGEVKSARHGLSTGNTWPVDLGSRKGMGLQLSQKDIVSLINDSSFFNLFKTKNWSELVCEPYGVELIDFDPMKWVFNQEYDQIHQKVDLWKLLVVRNFSPEVSEQVKMLEVELRTEEGTVETARLTDDTPNRDVVLSKTLGSILQEKDDRCYHYRFRIDKGSGFGTWSELTTVTKVSRSLNIYDALVEPLL